MWVATVRRGRPGLQGVIGLGAGVLVFVSCYRRAPTEPGAAREEEAADLPTTALTEPVQADEREKGEAPAHAAAARPTDMRPGDRRPIQGPPGAPREDRGAASWQHVGWGGGGFFWSCAYHPTDSDVIYLGGDVGGVYKTEDKGRHWRFVNGGLSNYAVHTLAISKSAPETLFAMTKDGVCKTVDGGRSWEFLEQTGREKLDISIDRPHTVRAIAIHPRDSNVVYAGSRRGKLYKTVDGGRNWRKLDYLRGAVGSTTLPPPRGADGGATAGGVRETVAFTGRGSLVLRFESDAGDWSRNGRAERMFPDGRDFAAYRKMTARFFLPRGAPKMQAQLVVQSGEKWIWQAGPFVEGLPGEWTEVSLDLAGLKELQLVRAVYFVIRSPHAGYRGSVYLDTVALHTTTESVTRAGEGTQDREVTLLADWEDPGDTAGWRHGSGRESYSFVTLLGWRGAQSQGKIASSPGRAERGVISSVAIAQARPDLVLATSTVFGVLRSDDAGETWTRPATPANASSVAVSPSDDRIVYAAFWKGGVRKSTDGGKTWTEAGTGIRKDCSVREVAVHPGDSGVVWAIGSVGWNGYFCRSTDGGENWSCARKTMTTDLDANPTVPDDPHSAGMSRLSNIAVSPTSPDEIFIAANWRNCFSADGGRTWVERSRGADITCVEDIRFCGGKTYVVAMDEGLLVSGDHGGSWRQLCPLKYSDEVSGHQWRVRVWKRGDTERIVSTLSPWNAKHANRVLVSDDGGKSFDIATEGLPEYVPNVNCMWGRGYPRALAADPRNPDVLYLGIDGDPEPEKGKEGGGVFRSVDGGRTWARLPNQPASRRVFFGLAVDPTDPDRVYWGACGKGGGLYRTDDGGAGWKHVFGGETWVFNVAVSPTGAVYCPGRNLWRSTDRGATWEQITAFTDDWTIVGVEIDPRDEKRIWISRVVWGDRVAGGVYRTTDGGATWEDITGDLPYRKPLVLRFNAETGHLWAGGVGLFRIRQ